MPTGIYLRTAKHRRIISDSLQGHRCSEETKEKIRIKHLGKIISDEARSNMRLSHQGLKQSLTHRRAIAESLRGKTQSPELIAKRFAHRKPIVYTEELREKLRQIGKRLWENPEHRRRCLARRTPSGFELIVKTMIDRHNLPYRYTGNGAYWVGNANPDFIHLTKLIVIEVYGSMQKKRNYGSIENYEQLRRIHYLSYGYQVIFINEKNLFAKGDAHCIHSL